MSVEKVILVGDREEQQDRICTFAQNGSLFCVVADGAGGMKDGALASQAIVDAAETCWLSKDLDGNFAGKSFLENFVRTAHYRVQQLDDSSDNGPRSTVVVLLVYQGKAYWAHCGDSRMYIFRSGQFLSRTTDHSVVQILLDKGKVSEEEMGTHPDQGKLFSSLGGSGEPEVEFAEVPLTGDEQFLLCSDGFWEHTSVNEMEQVLGSPKDLGEEIEKLAHQAVKRAQGESDNVSVIAISSVLGVTSVSPIYDTNNASKSISRVRSSHVSRSKYFIPVVVFVAAILSMWFILGKIRSREPQRTSSDIVQPVHSENRRSIAGGSGNESLSDEPPEDSISVQKGNLMDEVKEDETVGDVPMTSKDDLEDESKPVDGDEESNRNDPMNGAIEEAAKDHFETEIKKLEPSLANPEAESLENKPIDNRGAGVGDDSLSEDLQSPKLESPEDPEEKK